MVVKCKWLSDVRAMSWDQAGPFLEFHRLKASSGLRKFSSDFQLRYKSSWVDFAAELKKSAIQIECLGWTQRIKILYTQIVQ